MTTTRTILLTGATSGLGLKAARRLARDADIGLVVGARNPAAATDLRAAVPPERLAVFRLDTADRNSVADFCARVKALLGVDGRLDAIACNAGLQPMDPLRLSPDGHELTFATNHLGHFALVHRLLPTLAPGAAIVSTASGTHDPRNRLARMFGFRGGLFPDAATVAAGIVDRRASPVQQAKDRYATSKLCNILFAMEMARRASPALARFVAFDPGLMPGTGLARERSAPERFGWTYLLPALRFVATGVSTPERSGAALARLLADRAVAPETGMHVDFRLRRTAPSPDARRADLAADLYDFSVRACGIDPVPRVV